MKPIRALLLFVSMLGLLAPRSAEAAPAAPVPVPEARLRFLVLDESPCVYSLLVGAERRQLNATPYVVSRPVVARPGERLEVYRQGTDPVTGKPLQIRVAKVIPPAAMKAGLVVLTPRPSPADNPAAAPVYGVEFFDSDSAAFPPGSIRVLNLGRAPMAAAFGKIQLLAPPGESRVVRPVPDERNRVFGKIAVQTAAGWELLANRMTLLRPEQRVTGLLVYSPGGLRHTYTRQELAERGPLSPGHFWLTYTDSP